MRLGDAAGGRGLTIAVASSGFLPPSAPARIVFVREKGIRNALVGAFRDSVVGMDFYEGSPSDGPEENAGCVLSGQRQLDALTLYLGAACP